MWFSTSRERNTGERQDCEADVIHICRKFGIEPERELVSRAAEARLDYMRHVMTPRPDAPKVLSQLKEAGHKTGLISDCTHEVPAIWPETTFAPLIDVAVFSCSVGMRKPDPRIYHLAAERLEVRPEQCLFVGDGGSNELSGALEAGMHPVLIRLDADSAEPHLSRREEWSGPTVSSLQEIVGIAAGDGG
jgi:putative hydrolase of the HAD superfamily